MNVAQLVRASGCGPEGCRFESGRSHLGEKLLISGRGGMADAQR